MRRSRRAERCATGCVAGNVAARALRGRGRNAPRAGPRLVEIAIESPSGDEVPDNDRRLLVFDVARGVVTGVEGYVESAAMGMVAGRMAAAERLGRRVEAPPATTALGALVNHITGGHVVGQIENSTARSFQPMNINFGLLPPVTVQKPEGHVGRWKSTDKTIARRRR